MADSQPVPATPKVTAPSPTASEHDESSDHYFPPVTRSATKRTSPSKTTSSDAEVEAELRSRARSRSPILDVRRRTSGHSSAKPRQSSVVQKSEPIVLNGLVKDVPNGAGANNLLSPASAWETGTSYWRAISRSPSPLGLIPIHRHWRSFVHRHEVPRKALHVSIGIVVIWLYTRKIQPEDIYPWLLAALIPIVTVDVVRHKFESFNRIYVRYLGALMRESEVHEKYNGVIFYLGGVYTALRFFPKDIAVMAILLLSWCDTAASTFGRLYGRYTPRIRKGKSLAGSLAALLTGVATVWIWYGGFVPAYYGFEDDFMYQNRLSLPDNIRARLGLRKEASTVEGTSALILTSIVSGFIASGSELIDIYGLDDNITIPILSAVGLWLFLRCFG